DLRRHIEALAKLDTWLDVDGGESGLSREEPEEPPERVGRFRIIRELGRGGMGVVYEAVDENLGRRVAVKVLRRDTLKPPTHRARFRIEALALAGLQPARIVEVREFGHADGVDYIAMPFVECQSLPPWPTEPTSRDGTLHSNGPQDLPAIRTIARIGAEIAEAL